MSARALILVVDDHQHLRQFLRTILLRAFPQADVLLVADARDAISVMSTHHVDLLVTDRHMPSLDGLSLLRHARERSACTARVLLTADVDDVAGTRPMAEDLCHAWFHKPVDAERFIDACARLLAVPVNIVTPQRDSMPTALPRATGAAPEAPMTHEHPRLLVVDDVAPIAKVIATLAARLPGGANVEVESDPRKALARIERQEFRAIITDYRMPQVNGIDLLIAARRHQPAARRILVTGYNEVPEDLARVREADVDAYVHKPLGAQDTFQLLRDALSDDATAMDPYRTQARILEREAERTQGPLDLSDA